MKKEIGIAVTVSSQPTHGTEIKKDVDGVEKLFIYRNFLCAYVGGTVTVPQGAERVEWIPREKLSQYDLVPPSVKLLTTLGYLETTD